MMIPRSRRSRQPSTILTSGNYVVEIPISSKRSSKLRGTTNKLRPKKGSSTKLSNINILTSMKLPVLRDKTNLIKEPTTKFDILKKGHEVKDATNVETTTGIRTKRAKATKLAIKQNKENTQITEAGTKKNSQTTKKEKDQISKIKIPVIQSTSGNRRIISMSGKEIANATIVTKQVKNNENSKKNLLVLEPRKTRKMVVKPQSKVIKSMRTQKKSDTKDKLEFPPTKLLNNELEVSLALASTHETVANQSRNGTTRLSANKTTSRSPKANAAKKIFKSKFETSSTLLANSKIKPSKKQIVSKNLKATDTRKNTNKTAVTRRSPSFRLRQQTLQDSFAKQPKKVLRRRTTTKNYCEETQLTDESKNKIEQKNFDKKKGPVYKLSNNLDENNTDKDKVYEFVFDSNDSKERAKKKKKKRIIQKVPSKKVKITPKEFELKPTSSSELPTKKIDKSPTTIGRDSLAEQMTGNNVMKSDNKITTVTAEVHLPPSKLLHIDKESLFRTSHIISKESQVGQHFSWALSPLQPQSVNNDSISSKISTKFNLPPSTQFKTMMDASLLRRSLSPIPNENQKDNIEVDNPWRAPSLNTFSRVKNVFQSTPQNKKFGTLSGKSPLSNEITPKPQRLKMKKIAEQNDENANISLRNKSPRKFGTIFSNNTPIKQQSVQMNTSKSPRKFGTVISNINESSLSISPIINDRTRQLTNINQSKKQKTMSKSLPNYDEIISLGDEFLYNKENSEPTNANLKKVSERIDSPRVIPLHSKDNQKSAEIESLKVPESQPGPSGSQKLKLSSDTWNLKQSNLNKFLNLPEMPSSTRISTARGIFDDMYSTPIVGKSVEKTTIEPLNVNNAFGFDDDNDDNTNAMDVLPIKRCYHIEQSLVQRKLETRNHPILTELNDQPVSAQEPARFSTDEIKKKLLVSKTAESKKINQEYEKKNFEIVDDNDTCKKKKEIIKAIEFSDTFDNKIDEVDGANIEEIPLFVDIEPVHFTQPPRYSYTHKRKRNKSWNTNEETEDDESQEDQKRTKKKKVGKAEREQNKILNEWAKNMNNTFEEIDHFDLIVE